MLGHKPTGNFDFSPIDACALTQVQAVEEIGVVCLTMNDGCCAGEAKTLTKLMETNCSEEACCSYTGPNLKTK
eukprot:5852750-Amphidinium_carterae.1